MTANTGTDAAGRVRTVGLALVMLGALSVSVRGQVEAVWPLLGWGSIVLALTNDVAALLALNEVVSTSRADVRRWAWAVLLLAGGTAAGLNTWHALTARVDPATLVPSMSPQELAAAGGPPLALPPVWAVVVGAGPVLLAMVLSHLMALASTEQIPAAANTSNPAAATELPAVEVVRVDAAAAVLPREAPAAPPPGEQAGEVVGEARVAEPAASTPEDVAETAKPARAMTSRGGQVALALTTPGTHRVLAVVPSSPREADAVPDEEPNTAADSPDDRVAALVEQLRAGVALTGADVGEQLDCSARTGRRLLRQAVAQLETEDGTTQHATPSATGAEPAGGEAPAREERAPADGTEPRPERSNPPMNATTTSEPPGGAAASTSAPTAVVDALQRDTRTG